MVLGLYLAVIGFTFIFVFRWDSGDHRGTEDWSRVNHVRGKCFNAVLPLQLPKKLLEWIIDHVCVLRSFVFFCFVFVLSHTRCCSGMTPNLVIRKFSNSLWFLIIAFHLSICFIYLILKANYFYSVIIKAKQGIDLYQNFFQNSYASICHFNVSYISPES